MNKPEFYKLCCRYLSPHISDDMANIYEMLEEYDLRDIEFDLNSLLNKQEDVDASAFPSLLIDFISQRAINVLTEEGVIFYNDFDANNVSFLRILLSNHLAIKEIEDSLWIRKLIEEQDDDVSNLDIYYEIQTSISEAGTENMYEYISTVTDSLIDGILSLCDGVEDDESDETLPPKQFTKEIKDYYKSNAAISSFIKTYFDIELEYSVEQLAEDDYFKEVILKDNQYSAIEKSAALFILLKGHHQRDHEEDKKVIIFISKMVSNATSSDIFYITKQLGTIYKDFFLGDQDA